MNQKYGTLGLPDTSLLFGLKSNSAVAWDKKK